MIILVACLDMANGIGDLDGNLLFDLPKDMKRFKQITSNETIVMGRKTWDSLPIKPLPRRKNYVMSRDVNFNPMGAEVLSSVEDVLKLSKSRDVYVIGGGEIYELLMPYADKMMLTQVHGVNYNARVFFPDFSPKDWDVAVLTKHKADDKHAFSFAFATYERKQKQDK